jgi:hypothetical protein
VPTIFLWLRPVGTARERLRPPCGFCEICSARYPDTKAVNHGALVAAPVRLTGSRKRSSSGGIRGGCIRRGAEREAGRSAVEALQANQPGLVIVEIPARLRTTWQNTRHAIGHASAASAIACRRPRSCSSRAATRRTLPASVISLACSFMGIRERRRLTEDMMSSSAEKRLGETPLIELLYYPHLEACPTRESRIRCCRRCSRNHPVA